MWEKFSELSPQTRQDAPFANDNRNYDSVEYDPTVDDNNDIDDTNICISIPNTPDQSNVNINKPWEYSTQQDHFIIIINNENNFDDIKERLKRDLLTQGLQWQNHQEELRAWHFGLTR